ncbi:DUF3891 family protein [Mucilaginibacter sp.]|uniref:DUF3891 family protein n=1 Tax=Mucilaginibacter sp. TaxID=1882438 RepID=UPI003D0F0FEC
MIVNYNSNGWELITQRAHGLLAAQLAAQWRHRDRTERWIETLMAIAEHDDAQTELEQDTLLTPQGGPLDFRMKKFDLNHCIRTGERSLSKSRYIALLCSMHLDFVFGKNCAGHAEGIQFLKAQQRLRAQWRKELEMTKDQAEFDYHLLEWCDALSLLLCQEDSQPEERRIEISGGPDHRPYVMMKSSSNILTVEPWPFEHPEFEVYVETRTLSKLCFKNDNEFRRVFVTSPVKTKRWNFKKI